MTRSASRSVAGFLCATAVLASLVAVAATSWLLVGRQREAILRERIRTGGFLLEHLAVGAALPLLSDDTPMLNSLIKESGATDSILYAAIADRRDIVRAHTDPSRIGAPLVPPEGTAGAEDRVLDTSRRLYRLPDGSSVLELARAIPFRDQPVGSVRIGLPYDRLRAVAAKEAESSLPGVALLALGIGLAAAGISYAVGGRLSGSLSGGKRMDLPDFAGREVGTEEGEPSRNQITVLCAGVNDFRNYADSRDPDEVMRDLKEYYSIVSKNILGYGGEVYKHLGDVFVGVFGSRVFLADHTKRAVRAAVSMRKAFQENGRERNDLLRRVSIGISTGVVLSSRLNEGEKAEPIHIGEIFDAAGSLQEAAKPGDIVIGREVYQSIEPLLSVEPLPPSVTAVTRSAWEVFRLLRIEERRERA